MIKQFLLLLIISFCAPFSCFAWEDDLDDYFEDEFYDEGFEADEDSMVRKLDDLVYLLEKNIDLSLVPEQFIYPFGTDHKPMLASNLVQTVSDQAPRGFVSLTTRNTETQRRPGPTTMRTLGNIQGADSPGPKSVSTAPTPPKPSGSPKKEENITLPPFEIDGIFGSEYEQYIVVGTRYYTLEQTLRGTRELRRVRLVGIDDDHAYFRYRDMTFPKKIRALEKVFQ
jgi:hypothetical protein